MPKCGQMPTPEKARSWLQAEGGPTKAEDRARRDDEAADAANKKRPEGRKKGGSQTAKKAKTLASDERNRTTTSAQWRGVLVQRRIPPLVGLPTTFFAWVRLAVPVNRREDLDLDRAWRFMVNLKDERGERESGEGFQHGKCQAQGGRT